MKTCPECGTQYEDHVPMCFVDGTALPESEAPAPSPPPTTPPPAPAPEKTKSSSAPLLLVGAVVALVLMLLIGGVSGIALIGMSRSEPPPEVAAAQAPPTPVPVAPVAVPEPEPVPAKQVGFTSAPAGAAVWEGDTLLCTTPCQIAHPAHAPLPRELVLKAPGYLDAPTSLEDPDKPQHVALKKTPAPRPAAGRAPSKPRAPAPDIGMER